MRVDVHRFCDDEDVLAGASEGALLLSKLIETVATLETQEVVILDFKHVGIATASFLREAALGFRDYCRNSRSNLYPVFANLGLRVVEEFESLLKLTGDIVVICETTQSGSIKGARVLGRLEEKQRLTLHAVSSSRDADAATLMRKYPEDRAKVTAWHNRLTGLCAKGILIEAQTGRVKTYKPVLEALSYGR